MNKEIEMNVPERLLLMGALPPEGSFVTLRLIRGIVQKVGLSAEELKEFGVKQENDQVSWNEKGAAMKKIEFGEKELDVVTDSLKKLDKEGKLKQVHLSIYEKFVGG